MFVSFFTEMPPSLDEGLGLTEPKENHGDLAEDGGGQPGSECETLFATLDRLSIVKGTATFRPSLKQETPRHLFVKLSPEQGDAPREMSWHRDRISIIPETTNCL